MRTYLYPVLIIALLSSCHSTKTASGSSPASATQAGAAERDGSSIAKAIIIMEGNEMTGVNAEYDWLKQHYPGYKSLGQALLVDGKKPYDRIKIRTTSGQEKEVYFDISHFYGK